jgi:hypothetical protein
LEEAGEYDITIEQGSDFELPLTYEAPEGSVVDFTGSTAQMHAREAYGSSTTLFELTTTNGGIILGGLAGTIKLKMAAAATAQLSFTRAVYDLEVVSSTGKVYKVIKGSVFLKREVTR